MLWFSNMSLEIFITCAFLQQSINRLIFNRFWRIYLKEPKKTIKRFWLFSKLIFENLDVFFQGSFEDGSF